MFSCCSCSNLVKMFLVGGRCSLCTDLRTSIWSPCQALESLASSWWTGKSRVKKAFPTAEALAGSRYPWLRVFCVQGAELETWVPPTTVSAWDKHPHFIDEETSHAQGPLGKVNLEDGKLEWGLGSVSSNSVWFLDCVYLGTSASLEGGVEGWAFLLTLLL